MADQRITQLTALTASGVADIDVLPIVDISASETKKVTAKDLVAAGVVLINASTIDIAKINQASATKLGTTSLADDAVTAAKLADDSSVSTASTAPASDNFEGRLWINTTDKTVQVYDAAAFTDIKVDADNYIALSVGTAAVAANAITYAKIQNVSATDKLLGRSSSGAGNVEEIVCTAAGRALIDDADATTQRTTLGLAIGTNVQAYDAGLQSIAGLTTSADTLIYTTASDTYATSTFTAAGRALLDDANAATQRTTLGLGSIATQDASAVAITGGSATLSTLTTASSSLGSATITGGSVTGITDLAVADGGTGASTAADARTNLGLAIGTNVQAYDPALQSIAGLTTAANQLFYTTASDTYATATLTAAGRALLDDADAASQRTTLGLGTMAVQAASGVAITGGSVVVSGLTSTVSSLGTATITGGSIAGITDLAVADGGTGASTAADARTNLGLAIGSNVQAYDAGLQSIAGLTTNTDQLIYTTAADTYATTGLTTYGRSLIDDADAATARTTLGLGTIATQNANAVAITGGSVVVSGLTSTISSLGTVSIANGSATLSGLTSSVSSLGTATITGGSITGITDLAVADGGTGSSTASGARTNLGLAIGSNVQQYYAGLESIGSLGTNADQLIYTTASNTYATSSLTTAGRALLDDADATTQRATLGLGSIATQASSSVAITGGSIAGITDLAVADGGTGASTAANARTNLGLGTLATQSGTFSGTSSGTNTGDQTITLTGNVTGTGTGTFAATIANDAVTGAKLADSSATVVSGNAPSGVGDFTGQQWLNSNTGFTYIWDGSVWQRTAGLQTITFSDTTPLSFSVAYPDNFSAVITSAMESQGANAVLVGPITGSAATPTFRSLTATDLPIATSIANGAVKPGTGLSVTGVGVLNHSNSVTAGTYTKVVVDAQGHVSNGTVLSAADVPSLDASKITTGTFNGSFLAENSVGANQLADNGIAQVSETQPVPEFAGQWWINPSDRAAYIWVGTVSPSVNGYWLNLGFGAATQYNLRFGGTYNATTNLVVSLNQYGVEAGLTVGQTLSAPSQLNAAVYLICTTGGTGTTPAPAVALSTGDWVLSQGTGSTWTKVGVVSGAVSVSDYQVLSDGTYFAPDMTGVADVRGALSLLWGRAQIASTVQLGVVLESSEVLVDNTTGAMTIGTVDEGTY